VDLLNGGKEMVLLLHKQCGRSLYPGLPAVCVRFPFLLCSFFFRELRKRLLACLIFVIYYEHFKSSAVGAGPSSNIVGRVYSTSPERTS
jgi:hypothetical protein